MDRVVEGIVALVSQDLPFSHTRPDAQDSKQPANSSRSQFPRFGLKDCQFATSIGYPIAGNLSELSPSNGCGVARGCSRRSVLRKQSGREFTLSASQERATNAGIQVDHSCTTFLVIACECNQSVPLGPVFGQSRKIIGYCVKARLPLGGKSLVSNRFRTPYFIESGEI